MKVVSIILMVILLFDNVVRIRPNKTDEANGADLTSKCFEELGCLETNSRWFDSKLRPNNLPPFERHIIKTDFLLIKMNKTDSSDLLYNNMLAKISSITSAGFNKNSNIIILIHDFTANGYTGWIKHLAKVLLDKSSHTNVISVDWQRGAEPPFDQAISNARLVALETIQLLREMKEKGKSKLDKVHIIGHGLGAHIAGYVGAAFNNVKKITGLDPSGPRFEGMPDIVRLNPANAKYVEVLHTDAYDDRSQGTREAMGHSDFYVNNAATQPDCPVNTTFPTLLQIERNTLDGGEISPGCSHKRSYKYFIESLSSSDCVFLGIKCDSYEDFSQGKCFTCGGRGNNTCRSFGLMVYNSSKETQSFYLNAAGRRPYCMYVYKVTVFITAGENNYKGYFDFMLIDNESRIAKAELADPISNKREYKEGANIYVYYVQPPKLHTLKEVKVRWNEQKKVYCFIYCKQAINVEKVAFKFLGTGKHDDREEETLCPSNNQTEIENESYASFVVCKTSLAQSAKVESAKNTTG